MSVRGLPPLSALRALAAFAEARSVSGAGALLNVSHAAVSQQLRALEAHLGVPLLSREGRGLALTAEGAQLAQTLREAFHAIAHEIETITGADADRPLQVTVTPMFAASWLMPRIGGFHDANPDIRLMLDTSTLLAPLGPGGMDLGIRFGRGDWSGVEAELLMPTDFVIVAARSVVEGQQIREPSDLLDFRWLQEIGTDEVQSWLTAEGVTETRVRRMTELPGNLLLDGLRAGQGVGATIRAFVEPDIARGDLVVLFEDPVPDRGYYIVHRGDTLRPAARRFRAWLRREAAA